MPHSTTWRPLGALPRVFACGLVVLLGGIRAVSAQQPVNVDKAALEGFYLRGVGPAPFDGRVADVADVPGNPDVMYMGHSSAGLYMSTNRDTTFTSVFDEGNTLSMGAAGAAGFVLGATVGSQNDPGETVSRAPSVDRRGQSRRSECLLRRSGASHAHAARNRPGGGPDRVEIQLEGLTGRLNESLLRTRAAQISRVDPDAASSSE